MRRRLIPRHHFFAQLACLHILFALKLPFFHSSLDLVITHKTSRHVTVYSGSKGNTLLGAVGRKGRGLSEGREVEGSRENRGGGSSGSTSTPSNSLPIPPLVPGVGEGKWHAKNRQRRLRHKLARQGYFELVGEVGALREKLELFERREEEGQRVQAIEDRGRGGQSGEAKPPLEGSRPHQKSQKSRRKRDRSEEKSSSRRKEKDRSEGATQIFNIQNAWF